MSPRCVVVGALAAALALVAPAIARAEEAAPSEVPAASDSVLLRNGGFYRGLLTEIVPGDHVTIVVEGGDSKTIPWAEVDRVIAPTGTASRPKVLRANPEPGAPSPPPASSPPERTTPAALDVPPAEPPPPRKERRAHRPLLVTGAVLFAAGYGPNLVAGAPSTVGLVGRVLILVPLLGLPCWFGANSGYLCDADHGAMQLLVPFVGPFWFAADHPRDSILNERGRPLGDLTKGLLYTSGGLQIAGLAAILASIAVGEEVPAPGRKAATDPSSFFVVPQVGAGTLGVTLGLHRW